MNAKGESMQLGMIGLGKMGGAMIRRLMEAGHDGVVYDIDADAVAELVGKGAQGADSLDDFVGKLEKPRTVWVMVPAGEITESTVKELGERLEAGDTIVDGGNSFFKDAVRRAAELREKGIHFVDVGTSGGVWGYERGYCLMIGGDPEPVERLEPVFRALAPGRGDIPRTPGRESMPGTAEEGFVHCGPVGSGHFVKMVHNGIEYGVMQAYAEGFDVLKGAAKEEVPEAQRFEIDLADVAEVWRRGSVISSWLLDLTAAALAEDRELAEFSGFVHDSGEGRWTVQTAVEEAVPANVITAALYARFRSRVEHSFADKVLSAMRYQFGGHVEKPSQE
jgi:6-phosphogluconate dehydrogenase